MKFDIYNLEYRTPAMILGDRKLGELVDMVSQDGICQGGSLQKLQYVQNKNCMINFKSSCGSDYPYYQFDPKLSLKF